MTSETPWFCALCDEPIDRAKGYEYDESGITHVTCKPPPPTTPEPACHEHEECDMEPCLYR